MGVRSSKQTLLLPPSHCLENFCVGDRLPAMSQRTGVARDTAMDRRTCVVRVKTMAQKALVVCVPVLDGNRVSPCFRSKTQQRSRKQKTHFLFLVPWFGKG